jgi:NADPH2:quinone reductase
MKAILSTTAGGPETLVLQETTDPSAGPGQIVVRVKSSGVNYPDTLIIEDRYQVKPPRPFSPGGANFQELSNPSEKALRRIG